MSNSNNNGASNLGCLGLIVGGLAGLGMSDGDPASGIGGAVAGAIVAAILWQILRYALVLVVVGVSLMILLFRLEVVLGFFQGLSQ